MDQPVNMAAAKSKFSELVGQAAYGGKRYILEKHGHPMAVLIGISEYQRWQEMEKRIRGQALPSNLRERQEKILIRAERLRETWGDPVGELVNLLAALPPKVDEFWFQLEEGLS